MCLEYFKMYNSEFIDFYCGWQEVGGRGVAENFLGGSFEFWSFCKPFQGADLHKILKCWI